MIDRRYFLAAGAALLASPVPSLAQDASKTQSGMSQPGMSHMTAYAFTFKSLNGDDIALSAFAGRPILVVNTASLCGYTPQYAPRWNFHNYRVGRDGGLKAGFASATEPSDPAIIVAIETELGRT